MLIDQSTFYHVLSNPEKFRVKIVDLMICIKTPKNAFWFDARATSGGTQVVMGKSVADSHVQARIDAIDQRGVYQTSTMLAVRGSADKAAFLWVAYAPIDQYDTLAYKDLREAVERMTNAV
jgi:hypothetical protein